MICIYHLLNIKYNYIHAGESCIALAPDQSSLETTRCLVTILDMVEEIVDHVFLLQMKFGLKNSCLRPPAWVFFLGRS